MSINQFVHYTLVPVVDDDAVGGVAIDDAEDDPVCVVAVVAVEAR
jgi:hypothetical protein